MDIGTFIYNVEKPLSTTGDVRQILEAYRTSGFYHGLTKVNTENKEMYRYDVHESDKYYSTIFNKWKRYVVELPREHFLKMAANGKYDKDFVEMREILKKSPDLFTKKEIYDFMFKFQRKEIQDAFEKYNPFDQAGMSWTYITNRYIDCRQSNRMTINHRLYLNVDSTYLHFVANYIMEHAEKNNLQFEFKFDECGDRADSLVIYCSDDNLMLYVNMLDKMMDENPELAYHIHKPPVLTGYYKGYIGYGEEYDKAKSSYNSDRADALKPVLDADFKEWKKDFMNFNYRQGDKIYTPLDYITYHLYENFVKAQARIYKSRKENNRLKPTDNFELLRNKNYLNHVLSLIKKYVYAEQRSVLYGNKPNIAFIEIPSIFGDTDRLYIMNVDNIIRGMYIDATKQNKDRLDRLRNTMVNALEQNNIARSVVVSQETREKVIKFRALESKVSKVTAARKVENKTLYDNLLFTYDKMAKLITENKGNSLTALKKLLEPYMEKARAFIARIEQVEVQQYSGSSQDFHERTQYYLRMMSYYIKRYDVQKYEEFRNLALGYEKIEEQGKLL